MKQKGHMSTSAKWGFIFVIPGLISYALFSFFPFISSIVQSFYFIHGAGREWRFILFDNYSEILASEDFWHSLVVTFTYVLMTVPLGTILSLIVAIAITEVQKHRGIFRALYFIPSVAGIVVIGIIFTWMYEPYNGLLNEVFDKVGLGPFLWLRGKDTALASIAVMTIWRTLGYNIVILIAGILAIPKSLYEAAEMDGVGTIRKHMSITIPLAIPAITFVLIYNTIQNIQVFTEIFVMTGGGPGFATMTIGYRIYQEAFLFMKFGKAAANVVILMLVIVCITLLQMKFLKQREQAME